MIHSLCDSVLKGKVLLLFFLIFLLMCASNFFSLVIGYFILLSLVKLSAKLISNPQTTRKVNALKEGGVLNK